MIIGDCCYFSGIERQLRTSTINAAASIVQAIADQEDMPVVALRWFDFQTYRGYRKRRGEYELDELLICSTADLQSREGGVTELEVAGERAIVITQDKEDFTVNWRPTKPCPAEVLHLFREYIGEPRALELGLTPQEVHARGYVLIESDERLRFLVSIAETWMRLNTDFSVAVVDSEGCPEDLVRSEGRRYTMWQRDETPP